MTETAFKIVENPELKRVGNIHHAAYRCRDAEQTRWFYEDILGFRLAMAFSEDVAPDGEEITFMHLFFEMGDGNYIAFFDSPSSTDAGWFDRKHSFDMHIAFEVESEEQLLAWREAINERGKTCLGPVEHDFVRSIYMYDPNGIQIEFTCKTAQHDELVKKMNTEARQNIIDWSAKTRAEKEAKFGVQAIDKRGNR